MQKVKAQEKNRKETDEDREEKYSTILNSDYFDHHPNDDLSTAYEILHGDGISGFFNSYPLTHEQAYEIKELLKAKCDSQSVKRFIMKLRDILEGAACLLDQPDYKTFKNDRKIMMTALEKSKQLTEAICDANAPITRFTNFHQLLSYNDEYETGSELATDCQELALTVSLMLGMLIRKLKILDVRNEKALKGRPTADSKGIVAEIAKAWESCFNKKPTNYAGGPFDDVIKIVLKGLNLPFEYPQRKIKEGLRNR